MTEIVTIRTLTGEVSVLPLHVSEIFVMKGGDQITYNRTILDGTDPTAYVVILAQVVDEVTLANGVVLKTLVGND